MYDEMMRRQGNSARRDGEAAGVDAMLRRRAEHEFNLAMDEFLINTFEDVTDDP